MHCARLALVVLAFAAGGAGASELTVSAAASLTEAFKAIGTAFEQVQAKTKVRFNFGASGALLQQIAQGAPVDVLATADEETMDQAEQRQAIRPGTRAVFATNALVVVVPREGTAKAPGTLGDLATPLVRRVAIGIPASVPVGRYAKAALEKAQLWAQVEPKAIRAQTVRQALDYVARGEVDAGFVYATDASAMRERVRVAFAVPTETPVAYPIAVVAASAAAAEAQEFVAFVRAPPAQDILRSFGFRAP